MLTTVDAFGRIGEENAFAVLARATALAAEGRDIINLGIGQPDFRTPEHIVEAAIKALKDGAHGYTPSVGILPLREAVSRDLNRRYGVEVDPNLVMIVPGGKVTMYAAIRLFGEPGAEILYPDPGFPIYRSMIEHTGATPVPVPIREENGFAFSAEETLALITPRTRLLIINSPANAGIAALDGPHEAVTAMVAEFDRRRALVVEGLNALPGVSCATPRGAFYAFPNVSGTGWGSAKALASALLEEAGVAVIGGPDFGVHGEGYLRLSYANSAENIRAALERMDGFLRKRAAA
ncbi:MAG: hypothetical protein B7Y84_14650 [Azorhizobium sp. 32-67-21]|nr:MAG: hypothetical protein B7Y84_14650 [Azorhizobium sp. 32-67-21]